MHAFRLVRLILCWALAIATRPCLAETDELRLLYDHSSKTLSLQEITKTFPEVRLNVLDPVHGKRIEYTGVDLNALLVGQFGAEWQKQGELIFTCKDGYQPVIQAHLLQNRQALLAYGQSGHTGFEAIVRTNGQVINPGPYYLVWADPDAGPPVSSERMSWPWQIVGIELRNDVRTDLPTAPPETAGEKAQRGFFAFRLHCLKCHSINGEGGDLGPELNYPVNVTEYWREDWIRRFIANPQSLRFNSRMPALALDGRQREILVEDIIAYLQAMSTRKQPPRQTIH